jgi:hypothetical protein
MAIAVIHVAAERELSLLEPTVRIVEQTRDIRA